MTHAKVSGAAAVGAVREVVCKQVNIPPGEELFNQQKSKLENY